MGGFAALLHEMRLVDADVMLSLLEVVRGQRHRQHRHPGVHPGPHQTIHNSLRDEVMPVDPAIDDQRGAGHRAVAARGCQVTRQKRHLERAGHVVHIDLIGGNGFGKARKGLIHDL